MRSVFYESNRASRSRNDPGEKVHTMAQFWRSSGAHVARHGACISTRKIRTSRNMDLTVHYRDQSMAARHGACMSEASEFAGINVARGPHFTSQIAPTDRRTIPEKTVHTMAPLWRCSDAHVAPNGACISTRKIRTSRKMDLTVHHRDQ